MRKTILLLLLAMVSIGTYAQNEDFIYLNDELGVEVLFPAKPTESSTLSYGKPLIYATYNILSAGLSYKLSLLKGGKNFFNMEKIMTQKSGAKIVSEYKINGNEIIELELKSGGTCTKRKIIYYKKLIVTLEVASQSCDQDKDVLPFFNSVKINNNFVVKPGTDLKRFNTYSIDYPKKDTVKQIVYVNSGSENTYQFENLSDVDNNIPENSKTYPYRFALIIGNEDYSSHQLDLSTEVNVDYARNDASAFKDYSINTFGIPEKNIVFILDGTSGKINQAINKINLIIKNTKGQAEIFVYYAGHGLPDEETKEPYLMPVDVSGKNASEGIKLHYLYSKLTEFPSKKVTVFIDACFSGGARNQGLVAARGVKIKPKEDMLSGNLIVFTASSGSQSSLPLKEENHGLYTYYLLKKIKETNGNMTYKELSDYLVDNISLQSVLMNDKEQIPQTNVSNSISEAWSDWKINN